MSLKLFNDLSIESDNILDKNTHLQNVDEEIEANIPECNLQYDNSKFEKSVFEFSGNSKVNNDKKTSPEIVVSFISSVK